MRSWIGAGAVALISLLGQAQAPPPANIEAPNSTETRLDDGIRLGSLPKNILEDQQAFFTAPFRWRERQWKLVLPLGAAAAVLVASDTAVQSHFSQDPATTSRAVSFSNAGLGALLGVGGGMYLWGSLTKNERMHETGFLSGEAAIDTLIDTSLIKSVAGRDRPVDDGGRGSFFVGGNSFPSQHAAISWAVASVIAHEYPGPMTKLLSYGIAGGISAARVQASQHFLSDVVIGSALGWYIGRQVYRARSSEADIDVRKWGKFERDEESEQRREAGRMGSSYVPLDSWVYSAFDRLAALGYVSTASAIVRPWTRLECARLLKEARDLLEQEDFGETDRMAAPLLASLDEELAHETELLEAGKNTGVQLESVYARFTGIAGLPLRDSFHFAQSVADDYGRPYGEGPNAVTGFATRSQAGPLAFYLRGEYQYAGSIPAYSLQAQQAIAATDGLPLGAAPEDALPVGSGPTYATTNRLRLMDAYAALNLSNWQLSFGKQSLWWGAGRSTALVISNNAEPMPMVRLDRVSPVMIPLLGAMRAQFFLARESGAHYVRLGPTFVLTGDAFHTLDPQPYIWGAYASFKPTVNFEFGAGISTVIAGFGRPLNLKTFLHSFSTSGNVQPVDPGDRRTEFDFSYRIPKLRDWLTLYAQGFAEDEPLPLFYPRRSAMNPGLYLARVPGIERLDLRVEGVYTNLPGLIPQGFFYSNAHYADGYRNYSQIIGSWIGRQGIGVTASSTYWFSARNRVTASYRRMVADKSFLQGGQLDDLSGSVTWMLRPGIEFSATSQYERWNFPLLAAGTRSNALVSLGLRLDPAQRLWPGKIRAKFWASTMGEEP